MTRVISLLSLFAFLLILPSCAATGGSTASRSGYNSPLDKGQDFLDRLSRLTYIDVSGVGPDANVRLTRADGAPMPGTPYFVLDGELIQTSFRNIYNMVVNGNDLVSVRRLNGNTEMLRYGVPSGYAAIEVVLAKGK